MSAALTPVATSAAHLVCMQLPHVFTHTHDAGDPGTLTPEHLLNIEKRVEARREGKRRRRAEQAVLREVC